MATVPFCYYSFLLTHLEASNVGIALLGDIRLVSEEVPNILDAVLNHRRSL